MIADAQISYASAVTSGRRCLFSFVFYISTTFVAAAAASGEESAYALE